MFLFLCELYYLCFFFFFFQAEDGIRDGRVTGVQTCALPILGIGGEIRKTWGDARRRLRERIGEATMTRLISIEPIISGNACRIARQDFARRDRKSVV